MPKKNLQHDINRKACAIVKDALHTFAQVDHTPDDYGIDFTFELFDHYEGKAADISGVDFHIQCKGTQSVTVRDNHVLFRFPTSRLRYYVDKKRRPVFIVVVDVLSRTCYWLFVQGYAADELDTGWRDNESIRLRIPVEQALCDLAGFTAAVHDADKRMREFFPGSPESAIRQRQRELEKADPRIEARICASESRTQITYSAKEPIQFQMTFNGKGNQVRRAFEDVFDRALAISAEEYGIAITAKGLPGQPDEIQSIVRMEVTNKRRGSVHFTALSEDGHALSSMELPGEFRVGAKEARFSATTDLDVLAISAVIGSPEKRGVPVTLSYNWALSNWEGRPLLTLPNFDRLHKLFSALPVAGCLRAELYIEGNLIGSIDSLPNPELERMRRICPVLDCIRDARLMAQAVHGELKLTSDLFDSADEIDRCVRLLKGEALPLVLSDVKVTTGMPRSSPHLPRVGDVVEGQVALCHDSYIRTIMGQVVNLGPCVFEAAKARLEAKVVNENTDDSSEALVDWSIGGKSHFTLRLKERRL